MKNKALRRLMPIVMILLIAMILLSACAAEEARVKTIFTFDTGLPFSTNFNDEDPRRQIKCSVILEVVDEAAVVELEPYRYIVRNAIIVVLGQLTMAEATTTRDLDALAERVVERVNEDLAHVLMIEGSNLVTRAYFTDFAVV